MVEASCFFCNARLYGSKRYEQWIIPDRCPSCDEDVSAVDWEFLQQEQDVQLMTDAQSL